MTTREVSFLCNCGNEITVKVTEDEEYNIVCPECGQEYRFTGASLLRWGSRSS
jgi:DNA-directed RNA polymerase subunit M/transcription elongation factor TFIIS